MKSQVSAQERKEAEEALRSLKMKMANAPKKPIAQANHKVGMGGGYNQKNFKMNNNNFDIDLELDSDIHNNQQFNYNSKIGNYNKPIPKTGLNNKSSINKKPMISNKNNFKSGINRMNNNFGGGFVDNRPLGGGLTAEQMPNQSEVTKPCPHCGRKFNEISYPKHVQNCQKVFLKKRKAFNTQKQRLEPEQASLMKQGALEAKMNPKLKKKGKEIPKWKLQSLQFRSMCNPNKSNQIKKELGLQGLDKGGMVVSKGGNKGKGGFSGYGGNMGGGYNMGGMGMGMGMGGYPSTTPLDYTHCKYCNRNYNEEAYNKHLNGCKRRYEEAQLRNKISKKPAGKTNYKSTNVKSSYGQGQINYPKYTSNKIGKKK